MQVQKIGIFYGKSDHKKNVCARISGELTKLLGPVVFSEILPVEVVNTMEIQLRMN